jgi:hypothetical protein
LLDNPTRDSLSPLSPLAPVWRWHQPKNNKALLPSGELKKELGLPPALPSFREKNWVKAWKHPLKNRILYPGCVSLNSVGRPLSQAWFQQIVKVLVLDIENY